MSRIGKNPVTIPQGVTVEVAGQVVTCKGKLGTLKLPLSGDISAAVKDGKVTVTPKDQSKRSRMQWGTTRAHINNMVAGVSKGFTKNLEIEGVGYRAAVQGKNLVLQLGYSHDVVFPIPADIKITCEKPTSIAISGPNRQQVGETAAVIRAFRKPEPYKGKGIKYADEHIRRKEGKKK
jgi:large subunit ribosomal protein L6